MIEKAWKDLSLQDIVDLVNDKVPEGPTLDYKEKLPDDSFESKWNFLADVAAMANAQGGDLVFGVRDQKIEGKTTGLPESLKPFKLSSAEVVAQAKVPPRKYCLALR